MIFGNGINYLILGTEKQTYRLGPDQMASDIPLEQKDILELEVDIIPFTKIFGNGIKQQTLGYKGWIFQVDIGIMPLVFVLDHSGMLV